MAPNLILARPYNLGITLRRWCIRKVTCDLRHGGKNWGAQIKNGLSSESRLFFLHAIRPKLRSSGDPQGPCPLPDLVNKCKNKAEGGIILKT